MDILMFVYGQWEPGVMHDILYVPAFHSNLFSTVSAAQRDVETLHTKVRCQLLHCGELIMEGILSDMECHLNIKVVRPPVQTSYASHPGLSPVQDGAPPLQLCHRRLCHMNHQIHSNRTATDSHILTRAIANVLAFA